MFNAVDDLSCADLQNVDTRSTAAKDELLILADLEQTNKQSTQGKNDSFYPGTAHPKKAWHTINIRLSVLA